MITPPLIIATLLAIATSSLAKSPFDDHDYTLGKTKKVGTRRPVANKRPASALAFKPYLTRQIFADPKKFYGATIYVQDQPILSKVPGENRWVSIGPKKVRYPIELSPEAKKYLDRFKHSNVRTIFKAEVRRRNENYYIYYEKGANFK